MSDEDDIYKILFDDDFDDEEKRFGSTEDDLCFDKESFKSEDESYFFDDEESRDK